MLRFSEELMIVKKRTPYPSIDNVFLEREDNYRDNSVTYSFFYGEEPCRHLILNSEIAKKLAAYSLIQKDLISVYGGIKHLIELQRNSITSGQLGIDNENNKFLVLKSLHQAAVVTYAKCFASASGGKTKSKHNNARGVKLEKSIISDFPQAQKEAHEYLINTRNEYIAHGGSTNYEQSLSFVVISPKNKIISNILTMEAHTATTSIELLETILELVKNIQESLKVMQNKKSEIITRVHLPKITDRDIQIESVSSLKLSKLS